MYENYKYLTFERRGFVLTVILNNPPANAVNFGVHSELSRVFRDIQHDPHCNVVVLTGAGRHFSAGGDLHQMLHNLEDRERMAIEMAEAPEIVHSLLALDRPTIAQVNGHAIGLGATLALLCDIVFASETAKFADPHVNVGLSAGDGGALIWPHLIGYTRARHHLLTGDPLSAAEAVAAGLIYKAVPADQLDEAVQAYAERLAAKPLQALSATKKSLNMALSRQALTEAEAHIGLETLSMIAPDHREALLALIEKRDPKFTHGRFPVTE